MKKIALITYYEGNFGSILQCYATKRYLASIGCECDLLSQSREIKEESSGVLSIIYKCLRKSREIITSTAHDPTYLYRLIKYRNEKVGLTAETRQMMDDFSIRTLKPIVYSEKGLQKLGGSSKYEKYIVGSDQVWNFNNEFQSIFSLSFAPREARIALSVSIGEDHPNRKFKKQLKKVIKNFDRISVREKTAKIIIEEISDVNTVVMPDPTFIFERKDWKEEYKDKNLILYDKPYILIHFLNHPSETALKTIEKVQGTLNTQVVCIGYCYNVFFQKGWTYLDCNPMDYVAFIDNAEWVLTDSFHTTVLSINLEKDFFVFERMYMHGFPQTTRIENLLKTFHLERQFVTKGNNAQIERYDKLETKEIVATEHYRIRQYLCDEINTDLKL